MQSKQFIEAVEVAVYFDHDHSWRLHGLDIGGLVLYKEKARIGWTHSRLMKHGK